MLTGDGKFSSGTLKKGDSYSFKFNKTGTYKYICAIHPFMKGSVKVTKSSGGGGGDGSNGGSGGNGSGGTSPSNGDSTGSTGTGTGTGTGTTFTDPAPTSTLPMTGFGVLPLAILGAVLLALGLLMRLPAVRNRFRVF